MKREGNKILHTPRNTELPPHWRLTHRSRLLTAIGKFSSMKNQQVDCCLDIPSNQTVHPNSSPKILQEGSQVAYQHLKSQQCSFGSQSIKVRRLHTSVTEEQVKKWIFSIDYLATIITPHGYCTERQKSKSFEHFCIITRPSPHHALTLLSYDYNTIAHCNYTPPHTMARKGPKPPLVMALKCSSLHPFQGFRATAVF